MKCNGVSRKITHIWVCSGAFVGNTLADTPTRVDQHLDVPTSKAGGTWAAGIPSRKIMKIYNMFPITTPAPEYPLCMHRVGT